MPASTPETTDAAPAGGAQAAGTLSPSGGQGGRADAMVEHPGAAGGMSPPPPVTNPDAAAQDAATVDADGAVPDAATNCTGVPCTMDVPVTELPGTPRAVADAQSGREWMEPPATGSVSAATAYCETLSLGGHEDWRLPTIDELRSLIRGCEFTQVGGPCGVSTTCDNVDQCYGPVAG